MKPIKIILPIFVLAALLMFAIVTFCGIFNPDANCDMVGGGGMPPLKCSGAYTKKISNIRYNPSNRIVSYDFSITCDGKKYSGHVDNRSRTITVNGTECTF